MKRKCILTVLALLFLTVLAGWGKKTVELLNDKKLIDLNAALGNCILGEEDLIQENNKTETEVTPSAAPKLTPTATPRPTAIPVPTSKPQKVVIEIRVRAQTVTYNMTEWKDLDKLEEQIRKDYGVLLTFRLKDDYAEAHVYREMIAMLEKLEKEIGLRYIRD